MPMGGGIFKYVCFNSYCRFRFVQKSVFTNYSSFSKIGSGTQSKMKDLQKRGEVKLCPFLLVFSIFDYVPIGIF